MLTEMNIGVAAVSYVLLATIPYSWKFVLSPFVKAIILRHTDRIYAVKKIALVSQLLVFLGFTSIGFYDRSGSLVLLCGIVLLTVVSVSVHDIVRTYVKLSVFDMRDLGIATSVENVGFRIGMLLAGACLLYTANVVGWRMAYVMVGASALLIVLFTFLMSGLEQQMFKDQEASSDGKHALAGYIRTCVTFFRSNGLLLLVSIMLSFKFADSCINCLKGAFLHSIGIGKLMFANISHIAGVFVMIASGTFAGVLISKIGSRKCVAASFFGHCLASIIFMFLAGNKVDTLTLTLLVNASTFVFGFSCVVFRTFIAEQSNGDVNICAVLLSVGSVFRILSCSLGGFIAENFSWPTAYLICLVANVPGLITYAKFYTKAKIR
jgi:PAT family beta-lactamase induction signal transducer AmpG